MSGTDFSDFLENKANEVLARAASYTGAGAVYMALFTIAPTDAGGGTEAAYSGYARQAVSFSAPASQSIANSNALTYAAVTGAPVTVVALGIFDASTVGNLLAWVALTPTLAYAINDVPIFDVGGITVTLANTGGLSDYSAEKVLNIAFRGQAHTGAASIYMGLFSSAPTGGGGGTEFAHTGYLRKQVTFGASAGGVIANTALLTFVAVAGSAHTLAALAVFDAAVGGNMLYHKTLGSSINFAVGNVPKVAAAAFTVTIT